MYVTYNLSDIITSTEKAISFIYLPECGGFEAEGSFTEALGDRESSLPFVPLLWAVARATNLVHLSPYIVIGLTSSLP